MASFGNSTTAESAEKLLTVTQATQKLAKAETKAFTEKKQVKVTYTIKCSKKNQRKTTDKILQEKYRIIMGEYHYKMSKGYKYINYCLNDGDWVDGSVSNFTNTGK